MRTLLFLLFIPFFFSCTRKTFHKLDPSDTGIDFNNAIIENDSINILDLEYVYNGGGVAIADFNNDGKQDVFFTGNIVGNRLYLNKGNMKFSDVTDIAQVGAKDKWNTGVAVVDINADGLMDIYVCASIKKDAQKRANSLFINKGLNKDGIPVFADEAAAYHIADTSHSTTAAFFDYDNDGDLDLYILTNKMAEEGVYPNQYRKKIIDGSSPTTDHLYRNDFDSSQGHAVFTDVSRQAGILIEGYGLGLNITDINQDGWKDIYVTNDFLTNDLLWINNHDGTFTNRAAESFKHTSYSAMGNDVVDINNDGLPDMIAVDMLPATNLRKKMMTAANAYQTYMNNDAYGYEYQYGRNTLQINQGRIPDATDSNNVPLFSDVAFYAGIAETDWSWTPMVCDFDNDSYRDIIITNGFPKDITDRDFMTYRVNARSIASKSDLLEQIPMVKLHNYAFRNQGNLRFSDVSDEWGLSEPTFSNGAAYADLDNDGDMDLVINNINDKASVYENHSGGAGQNYLNIQFEGSGQNRNGIGAIAEIFYDHGKHQLYENSPYRGFLSTVQALAHFGLGKIENADSLVIRWPDHKMQILKNIKANQLITVKMNDASLHFTDSNNKKAVQTVFVDVSDSSKLNYVQKEIDFPDFNIQKLLPHKLSEYGPGVAVGDIDGNGLDDMICGGSFSYSAVMLLQQQNGKFISKDLIKGASAVTKPTEDLGILLFDADGDHDLDLYIASGSYENAPNSNAYHDMFYLNDGKGNFMEDSLAIPVNYTSKSCVRAADYDKDGDLDLFVAGRVEPWNYPKPVSSFIYRNDSKAGQVKFTDVTSTVAPSFKMAGMVCDAVFTDFDNDGWQDLIFAGEWMDVRLYKNEHGIFKDISASSGISNQTGWWNSIAPGDFDNDGDMDYILGNTGENTFYRVSPQYPAKLYAKDFNNDGNYDAIPTLFLQDEKGKLKEYPAQTRDDLIKQMITMRAKFKTYQSFANAGISDLLSKEDLKDAIILQANNLNSCLMKNTGNGHFELIPLPAQAQLSSLNGMAVGDFDGDHNLDVVVSTNDFGTEVSVGRYDALNGLFLKGDGRGNFIPVNMDESGICIKGNGKAMVMMNDGGKLILAGSQNRGPLKLFSPRASMKIIPVNADDVSAMIKYRDGKIRKEELFYGASFLSQSGRFLVLGSGIQSIEVTNSKGIKRILGIL